MATTGMERRKRGAWPKRWPGWRRMRRAGKRMRNSRKAPCPSTASAWRPVKRALRGIGRPRAPPMCTCWRRASTLLTCRWRWNCARQPGRWRCTVLSESFALKLRAHGEHHIARFTVEARLEQAQSREVLLVEQVVHVEAGRDVLADLVARHQVDQRIAALLDA